MIMSPNKASRFAEVLVDRLFLESFSNEQSVYSKENQHKIEPKLKTRLVRKLKWHINNSLSARQKEVIKYYLNGKKEREIAEILGITQQVVNIYKHRAIKKLTDIVIY